MNRFQGFIPAAWPVAYVSYLGYMLAAITVVLPSVRNLKACGPLFGKEEQQSCGSNRDLFQLRHAQRGDTQ